MAASILAALVIVSASASSSGGKGEGLTTETSVAQVEDTLRNLLKSTVEEGSDANNLYKMRHKICDSASKSLEAEGEAARTAVAHLKMDVNERKASMDEVEGMEQQIQSDMALILRTVNQTEVMLLEERRVTGSGDAEGKTKTLAALVDNKKKTLTSLESELAVVQPALSRLRAEVAETDQRLGDRRASEQKGASFLEAFRDGCAKSHRRADARAEARSSVTTAVEAAVRALQLVAQVGHQAGAVDIATEAATAVDAQPADDETFGVGVSFVQTASSANAGTDVPTDDDLLSIFDGDGDLPAVLPAPSSSLPSSSAKADQPADGTATVQGIQHLLSTLESGSNASSEQLQWCAQETGRSTLALRSANDALAQTGAQIEARTDSIKELQEEVQRVQQVTKTLKGAISEFAQSSEQEQQLLARSEGDQKLAVKILQQASTILADLGNSRLAGKQQKWAQQAASQLTIAKKVFEGRVSTAGREQREVDAAAVSVSTSSADVLSALAHEDLHLGRARDAHQSQISQEAQDKITQAAEVEAARSYSEKLAKECQQARTAPQEQGRKVEVHALEDAAEVLEGKIVQATARNSNLRRAASANGGAGSSTLTPMERAAAEMGIAVDDSSN